MKASISERVAELAQESVESELAWEQGRRPRIEEIQKVEIVDSTNEDTFVEISLQIHRNGDAVESLTIQFRPHKYRKAWTFAGYTQTGPIKIFEKSRLKGDERQQYRVFGAIVGRLTYFEANDEA